MTLEAETCSKGLSSFSHLTPEGELETQKISRLIYRVDTLLGLSECGFFTLILQVVLLGMASVAIISRVLSHVGIWRQAGLSEPWCADTLFSFSSDRGSLRSWT